VDIRCPLRGTADYESLLERDRPGMLDEQLSERERTVAVLIAYGYRNADVARELNVSLRTAEYDRARLMRKLGLTKRSELVRWALAHDLLQLT